MYRTLWKITPRSTGLETGKASVSSIAHTTTDAVKSNELNAGYAADGYARIKEGGIAVITTT